MLTPPAPIVSTPHEGYMARCLELAYRGWATARPNPMVGAVVIHPRLGVVGEGYHVAPGQPHAEVAALKAAGEKAEGATLYVNLEPCNHYGRTRPCTEAILQAGVKTVVYGCDDPNPKAQGGAERLRQAGVDVIGPVLEASCKRLNKAFLTAQTQQRPFVTLKLALTLDGKVACRNGHSQWITGPEARAWVHHLRAGQQAVLSSARSVIADRSQLTVRNLELPDGFQQPTRVILDRQLSLAQQLDLPVLNSEMAPTLIVCSEAAFVRLPQRVETLKAQDCQVFSVSEKPLGQLNLEAIWGLLLEQGIHSVLVEAGARLSQRVLQSGMLNKAYFIYNPKLTNDPAALSPFYGELPWLMKDSRQLTLLNTKVWGQDIALELAPSGEAP